VLRLAPDAFWAMTPRELAAAIRAVAPPPATAMTRRRLADLMAGHPD